MTSLQSQAPSLQPIQEVEDEEEERLSDDEIMSVQNDHAGDIDEEQEEGVPMTSIKHTTTTAPLVSSLTRTTTTSAAPRAPSSTVLPTSTKPTMIISPAPSVPVAAKATGKPQTVITEQQPARADSLGGALPPPGFTPEPSPPIKLTKPAIKNMQDPPSINHPQPEMMVAVAQSLNATRDSALPVNATRDSALSVNATRDSALSVNATRDRVEDSQPSQAPQLPPQQPQRLLLEEPPLQRQQFQLQPQRLSTANEPSMVGEHKEPTNMPETTPSLMSDLSLAITEISDTEDTPRVLTDGAEEKYNNNNNNNNNVQIHVDDTRFANSTLPRPVDSPRHQDDRVVNEEHHEPIVVAHVAYVAKDLATLGQEIQRIWSQQHANQYNTSHVSQLVRTLIETDLSRLHLLPSHDRVIASDLLYRYAMYFVALQRQQDILLSQDNQSDNVPDDELMFAYEAIARACELHHHRSAVREWLHLAELCKRELDMKTKLHDLLHHAVQAADVFRDPAWEKIAQTTLDDVRACIRRNNANKHAKEYLQVHTKQQQQQRQQPLDNMPPSIDKQSTTACCYKCWISCLVGCCVPYCMPRHARPPVPPAATAVFMEATPSMAAAPTMNARTASFSSPRRQ